MNVLPYLDISFLVSSVLPNKLVFSSPANYLIKKMNTVQESILVCVTNSRFKREIDCTLARDLTIIMKLALFQTCESDCNLGDIVLIKTSDCPWWCLQLDLSQGQLEVLNASSSALGQTSYIIPPSYNQATVLPPPIATVPVLFGKRKGANLNGNLRIGQKII